MRDGEIRKLLLWLLLVCGLVLYLSFGFPLPAVGAALHSEATEKIGRVAALPAVKNSCVYSKEKVSPWLMKL